MAFERRGFLAGAAALGIAGPSSAVAAADAMYGRIGRMTAMPGQRAAFAAILIEGTAAMPGCLGYVDANDATDADVLWITEVWTSKEAHAGSLAVPAVRAAIARGRPLIAAMETIAETHPVGGAGLAGRP